MTDMTAFERQLSGEVGDLMGPVRPTDDLAIFESVTAASRAPRWEFTMFSALKLAAASVGLALFGAFLLSGVLTPSPDGEIPPAALTESPSATPTSEAVAPDDLTRTVAGPGPWLVWERAPELDEQPVEGAEQTADARPYPSLPKSVQASWVVERGDYVLAVQDGDATRSDSHGLLDDYIPLRMWVIGPDGEAQKHVVDRAYRVSDAAIGPAGILVRTTKGATAGGIQQLAVAGRSEKGKPGPRCCDLHLDGTVTTDGSGGLPHTIEYRQYRDKVERIGLRRADLRGPRYWLWRDGQGWSKAKAPPEAGQLEATDDGYFLLGRSGRLHFSPDIRTWIVIAESLGESGDSAQVLTSNGDQILYLGPDEVAWVGPSGLERTPFAEFAKQLRPDQHLSNPVFSQLLTWPEPARSLVLIDDLLDAALFLPGGEQWGVAPLAAPVGRGSDFEIHSGQLVHYVNRGGGGGRWAFRAIVSDLRPE